MTAVRFPALPRPDSPVSGAWLKWLAIVTMFCDHLSCCLLMPLWGTQVPVYSLAAIRAFPPELQTKVWTCVILRFIGRIAFPIFCFLIVEGLVHTHDRWRYAGRLAIFALISDLPFDYAVFGGWDLGHQNVFFTLLIGMLTCMGMDWAEKRFPNHRVPAQIAVLLIGFALAEFVFCTDYGGTGVTLICIMYLMRNARLIQCLTGALIIGYEIFSLLAFIPIYFYNGKRGRQPKWFFYWFYPLHLALLFAARQILM